MECLRGSFTVPFLTMRSSFSFVQPMSLHLPKYDDLTQNQIIYDDANFVFQEDERSAFQSWHLEELEKCFHVNHYPTKECREKLARRFGVQERKLMIWFQNRRAKHRRINQTRKKPGRPPLNNPPITCDGSPIAENIRRDDSFSEAGENEAISQPDGLHSKESDDKNLPSQADSAFDCVNDYTEIGSAKKMHFDRQFPNSASRSTCLKVYEMPSFSNASHVWNISPPHFHSTPIACQNQSIPSKYSDPDSLIGSSLSSNTIPSFDISDSDLAKTPPAKTHSFTIKRILNLED